MSDVESVRFRYDANIPDCADSTAQASTHRHPHVKFLEGAHGIEMRSEKSGLKRMVPWEQVLEVTYTAEKKK